MTGHLSPRSSCLQGPILLSLLSVFYTLHSEFMGSGGGGGPPAGGPLHRLWSLAPGTAGQSAAGPKGQGHHVRLAPEEPGGAAGSPEALRTGLRVSVPGRADAMACEGGAAFSPGACGSAAAPPGPQAPVGSPADRQQLEQQAEQSVSLSLGRRPGSAAQQASPSLLAAMSLAAEPAEVSGSEDGSLEGLEGGSQSFSASIADSFSFNALRSFKLHDD